MSSSNSIEAGRQLKRWKRSHDELWEMVYGLSEFSSAEVLEKIDVAEEIFEENCKEMEEQNYLELDDYNNDPEYIYFEENSLSDFLTNPLSKRLISNFNINKVVQFYEKKITSNDFNRIRDDKTLLSNEPDNFITKGTFSRRLLQWFEENVVSQNGQRDLLNIMHNAFGRTINLPVKMMQQKPTQNDDKNSNSSVSSIELLNKSTVLSSIQEYDGAITRFFAFHQCLNDCTVFIGDNYRSFECPECKSLRFRPCVRLNCEKRGLPYCEHLLQIDGVPFKQLFYRPIRLLILDLVRTEWFVKALKYKRKDFRQYYHYDNSTSENGIIADKNLQEMNNQFESWKKKDQRRLNYESVNILLSEFYDGVQLFKRRTKDFNCLITGILNLPPTYRGKEGISNFITAVYEGKHKFAEQVLFSDLYVEELQTLLHGIEFEWNGKFYFIQARLILHIMDTKAAEGVFKFQNCGNSTQGCPSCQLISGVHDGSKCIYPGHRYTLPINHFLRPIGQSNKCCPEGFYSENKWFSMETFPAGNVTVSSIPDLYKTHKNRQDLEFCLPCDGNEVRQQQLMNMYSKKDSESELLWYHTGDFSLENIRHAKSGLKRILFYRHYDLREYQQYNRYPYALYLEDANKAEQLNADREETTKKRKASKPKGVKGLKGVWPFASYPIADISNHSGPPGIHAITGCVRMLLDIILGEYILKPPKSKKGIPIKDCEESGLDLNSDNVDVTTSDDEYSIVSDDSSVGVASTKVPGIVMYTPDYRPKKVTTYSAKKHDINQVTYWLRCVLLPKGMNDDSWDIKLNSIGSLKMNQKLKVISCYWDLILLGCPSIDASYKLFYRMVAADLTQMQSFKFTLAEVDHLQKCILETISTWEGALPTKTLHYKVHQLVDLPSSLKNFGSLFNAAEWSGERMVGLAKDHKLKSNTGGCSFGNTVMRKQVRREMRKMNEFYSQAVNEKNSSAPNGKHLQLKNGELIFNDFPFKLHRNKEKSAKLSHYEVEHLVDLLLYEIEKREEKFKTESVLYNLIQVHRKKGKTITNVLIDASQQKSVGKFNELEILVATTLLNNAIKFYGSACIYGLEFNSRGCDYRQIKLPNTHSFGVQPGAKAYDIRRDNVLNWDAKASYSSWCMFFGFEEKRKFGQLNGFFEIKIGDPAIDGLLVASVTSREYEITDHICFVEEKHSLDVNQVFVSLQDICPTLIGVCPFNRQGGRLIAISLDAKLVNQEQKSLVCTDRKKLTEYALIILHPERLSGQPNHRPFTAFFE